MRAAARPSRRSSAVAKLDLARWCHFHFILFSEIIFY
jgi:hypothetical protein